MRNLPERREAYPYVVAIQTRWMDNDAYGHLNNVLYYSFFDTAVNRFLIERDALDIRRSSQIGVVVESRCEYFSPIAFPDSVHVGLRVGHLGRTSVRYEIGIFRNDQETASAQGHFVHAYMDRMTAKPVPLPAAVKAALDFLLGSSR